MSNSKPDVVVIGGGVIGLCSALYAGRDGATVTVLEKDRLDNGASYCNAGLLVGSLVDPLNSRDMLVEGLTNMFDPEGAFCIDFRPEPRFLAWMIRFVSRCTRRHFNRSASIYADMYKESIPEHHKLAVEAEGAYDFSNRGMIYLYRHSQNFIKAEQSASRVYNKGYDVEVLPSQILKEVEPAVGPKVAGGIWYKIDCSLDPGKFIDWLSLQCRQAGVNIQTGVEVHGFSWEPNRVRGVITTQGEIKADQVVLAAGAWNAPLGRKLGVNLPIEGGKGIGMTYESVAGDPKIPLLLGEAHVAFNSLEGKLRLTGLMQLSGLNDSRDTHRIQSVAKAGNEYIPAMTSRSPFEIHGGLRPLSADGLPIIGRLARPNNAIVAGGHEMKGISLGPTTGLYVNRLLRGESLATLGSVLSPMRFN